MRSDRQGDLVRAFVSLADALVAGYDVHELLQQLVDHCVDLLEVSETALLLADAHGVLHVAASSSDQMRRLELFQVQAEQGPCLDCFTTRTPVIAEDPAELAERWPTFASALADEGLLSVAAVPLRLRDDAVGAMGLFSDRVPAPDAMEVAIAQGLADIATIAIVQARAIEDSHLVSGQLQKALDSRVVIEQAKGVIAVRASTTTSRAFALIRDHARRNGLKLTDVAAAVVAGELGVEQLGATSTAPGADGRPRR